MWHKVAEIFENTVLVSIIVVFILFTTIFVLFVGVLTTALIPLQSRGMVTSCEEVVDSVFWPIWLLIVLSLGWAVWAVIS